MNLGDVFAVAAFLLGMGIALPGLYLAWALLLPATVERAQQRWEQTPWSCFLLGLVALVICLLPIVILVNLKAGPVQFVGYAGLMLLLALASIGSAGLALVMGNRLRGSGVAVTRPGALVRGAITLELACVFPLVGWFVLIPLLTIGSFGAACFALVHRAPRPHIAASDLQTAPASHSP
ncbi:MAG: hypothetical protein WCF84_11705 [Anaerolineae bacterium]